MKIKNLLTVLELEMGNKETTKTLISTSHWVSAIFQAKYYVVGNPKDIRMIRKLEVLGIVKMRKRGQEVVATLTKEGRELYQDFYKHGYYL